MDRMNRKTNLNIFNALSQDSTVNSAKKNLTQPKISQVFGKKRTLDESDFPQLVTPHKKVNLSSQPISEHSSDINSHPPRSSADKSLLKDPNSKSVTESGGEGVVSENSTNTPVYNLSFSNELQNIGDLLNADQASPKDKALLSLLNRMCEQLQSSEEKISELTKEITTLKSEMGIHVNRSKKEALQKSEMFLREEVGKSLKTLRIVGVNTEGKSNAEVIKSTINLIKDSSQSSPPSFEGVKVFKKQGSVSATIQMKCATEELKCAYENRGRTAGLKVRQNIPSSLVKTVGEIRARFNTYAETKNSYAMVKLGKNAIEVLTKSKEGKGGWCFLENIPYPYSKQQLKLNGGRQRFNSKFINVAQISIPEKY